MPKSGTCRNGWHESSSLTPSPYVALEARPHIQLVRAAIDKPGRYYHDLSTIVTRTGLLLERERRALWHELVHADRGDTAGHTDATVERHVERLAAEWAMPWVSIRWAWERAVDLTEMAGLLKLPEDWVHHRLMSLHPAQKQLLRLSAEARPLAAP